MLGSCDVGESLAEIPSLQAGDMPVPSPGLVEVSQRPRAHACRDVGKLFGEASFCHGGNHFHALLGWRPSGKDSDADCLGGLFFTLGAHVSTRELLLSQRCTSKLLARDNLRKMKTIFQVLLYLTVDSVDQGSHDHLPTHAEGRGTYLQPKLPRCNCTPPTNFCCPRTIAYHSWARQARSSAQSRVQNILQLTCT